MMKKNISKVVLGLAASMLLFTACNKKQNTDVRNNAEKASVNFHLTDAPANYDAVNIDIQQVEVTMEGSAAVALTPIRPGVYNLLEFRNGVDVILATAEMPPGKISQIRLILGSNNSVVADGQTYPLNTPSAQESGLKLNLKQEFIAGGAYDIWLDFDAGKSIHETGNGKFQLKPVIRAYSVITNGRIKGYVKPSDAKVTVYATNGVDTYSAITNSDGFYMITGLTEGSYDVTYDAAVALYVDVTIPNIAVGMGKTVDLGTTILIQ